MKKDLTEIVLILDISSSMSPFTSDSIGGINQFLEDQRKLPGEANVTITLFNDKVEQRFKGTHLRKIKENFNNTTYHCTGMTALYDGIGITIDEVGKRLSLTKEEDRPEHVIVAILTDGEENSSKEYTKEKINEMITLQRNSYNWEFVFLAANQDAFQVGNSLGVKNNFTYTADNTKQTYGAMSLFSTSLRSVGNTSQVDVDALNKRLYTKE